MATHKNQDSPRSRDVALIVGGGPGISASCARLFASEGMRVAVAARNPDKPVLAELESVHGVRRYSCDASEPAQVQSLFDDVVRDLGTPTLVVHNIDGRVAGIFRKGLAEADADLALANIAREIRHTDRHFGGLHGAQRVAQQTDFSSTARGSRDAS